TEDRSENYKVTIHGRDHVEHVELCGTKDGKITGLRTRVYAGLGGYASTAAPGIPTILHGLMYSGPYAIPNIAGTVYGVYTTTTPVDAYRGAGRPEATFLLERMIDLYARKIGMDPVEVRRKNLIPNDKFPYTVATGLTYDSGNCPGALDKALQMFDYKKFRAEQAKGRKEGRYLGVGVTTYCEICGLGPSQVAGAVGFGGGLYDSAIVRVYPTGVVRAYIGGKPHGQGEETTFAQIVADEFGIPVENVEVVAGDTEATPQGWGTYGSRTTAVCGSAVKLAAQRVKEKTKKIAAHLLEASEADLEWKDGKFVVTGSPDKGKTFAELALMANVAWNLPPGTEPGLEATAFFDPSNFVYPFGTHICTVDVDGADVRAEGLQEVRRIEERGGLEPRLRARRQIPCDVGHERQFGEGLSFIRRARHDELPILPLEVRLARLEQVSGDFLRLFLHALRREFHRAATDRRGSTAVRPPPLGRRLRVARDDLDVLDRDAELVRHDLRERGLLALAVRLPADIGADDPRRIHAHDRRVVQAAAEPDRPRHLRGTEAADLAVGRDADAE